MVAVGTSSTVISVIDQPVPQVAGITFLGITEQHCLAKEWFILINHPRCIHALIAHEITPVGEIVKFRLYEGILTSDPVTIARAEAALCDHLHVS